MGSTNNNNGVYTSGDLFMESFNQLYKIMADNSLGDSIDELCKNLLEFIKDNKLETKNTQRILKEELEYLKAQSKEYKGMNEAQLKGRVRDIINEHVKKYSENKNSGIDLSGDSELAKKMGELVDNTKKLIAQLETRKNDNDRSALGSATAMSFSEKAGDDEKKRKSILSGIGKGIGNIFKFLLGKQFLGAVAGAVTQGILGAKWIKGTIWDVIHLGILLLSSKIKKMFGDKLGGLTYIIGTTIVGLLGAILTTLGPLKMLGWIFRLFSGGKSLSLGGKGAGLLSKLAKFFNVGKLFAQGGILANLFKSSKTATNIGGVASKAKATGTALVPYKPQAVQAYKGANEVVHVGKVVRSGQTLKTGMQVGKVALTAGKLAKGVPVLGTAFGALDTGTHIAEGDKLGATMSGIATLAPIIGAFFGPIGLAIGTVVSVILSIFGIIRDWRKDSKEKENRDDSLGAFNNKKTLELNQDRNSNTRKIGQNVEKAVSLLEDISNKNNEKGLDDITHLYCDVNEKPNTSGGGGTGGSIPNIQPQKLSKKDATYWSGAYNMFAFPMTAGFGAKGPSHNDKNHPKGHTGMDFEAPLGTKVGAFIGGTVVFAANAGSAGNEVILQDFKDKDKYYYYMHLQGFGPGVKPGAEVLAGQEVGQVGATGRVSISNKKNGILHYESRKNPSSVTGFSNGSAYNPLPELQSLGLTNVNKTNQEMGYSSDTNFESPANPGSTANQGAKKTNSQVSSSNQYESPNPYFGKYADKDAEECTLKDKAYRLTCGG